VLDGEEAIEFLCQQSCSTSSMSEAVNL